MTDTRSSPGTDELWFGYTNWEGRNSARRVRPISIRYGKSKWHPREGWLMLAFDLDKNEEREFSMRDMVQVEMADGSLSLDVAQAAPNPQDLHDVKVLLQAIYDLIDDEDVAEPLDYAITHAKKALEILGRYSAPSKRAASPPSPVAGERADRLEDERNRLQNSYGRGPFADGLITRRIAEIDKELSSVSSTNHLPRAGATPAQQSTATEPNHIGATPAARDAGSGPNSGFDSRDGGHPISPAEGKTP